MLLYRPCLCCHCYCTVHVYVVIAIVPSMFMLSFIIVTVYDHFEWKQLCATRSSPYVPIGSYKALLRWSYSSQYSEYICYSVELESAGFQCDPFVLLKLQSSVQCFVDHCLVIRRFPFDHFIVSPIEFTTFAIG